MKRAIVGILSDNEQYPIGLYVKTCFPVFWLLKSEIGCTFTKNFLSAKYKIAMKEIKVNIIQTAMHAYMHTRYAHSSAHVQAVTDRHTHTDTHTRTHTYR